MKEKFKIKFTLKQTSMLLVFTTVFYGFILYLFNIEENLNRIFFQSIIYGVLMTLFFIFLFPWFMKKLVGNRIDNIEPTLIEGEIVEEEISANLFRGLEGVGGKIFLTNKRLVFKSHSLNIQKGQTNFNYSDIDRLSKRKTAKLIDNGIKLVTKDGGEFCFVVNNRDAEIKKIEDKLLV
jgi:hypothetical protein